jgi:hypothetical protein
MAAAQGNISEIFSPGAVHDVSACADAQDTGFFASTSFKTRKLSGTL